MSKDRRAISEIMSTLIMLAITLVAGAATFGYINGQVGVSATAYGNKVAGNINYLNERASITFVNFPGVGAADEQITIWIENTGKITLSSYTVLITGLYCGPASDTCATPANRVTITCTQGGGSCAVAAPPTTCPAGAPNPFTGASSLIQPGQMSSFTITLPNSCAITFQATANSPPAPQTVSFTVQFAGTFGATSTYVRNR